LKKYLITYGYYNSVEVVEAESEKGAQKIAYEMAREEFENDVAYSVEELTKELAEDHGFEEEL